MLDSDRRFVIALALATVGVVILYLLLGALGAYVAIRLGAYAAAIQTEWLT